MTENWSMQNVRLLLRYLIEGSNSRIARFFHWANPTVSGVSLLTTSTDKSLGAFDLPNLLESASMKVSTIQSRERTDSSSYNNNAILSF